MQIRKPAKIDTVIAVFGFALCAFLTFAVVGGHG